MGSYVIVTSCIMIDVDPTQNTLVFLFLDCNGQLLQKFRKGWMGQQGAVLFSGE